MSNPYEAIRSQVEQLGLKKPDAYNPYAAGPKVYGGTSLAPQVGAIGDKAGYMKRDARARAMKNVLMKKLKTSQLQNSNIYPTL